MEGIFLNPSTCCIGQCGPVMERPTVVLKQVVSKYHVSIAFEFGSASLGHTVLRKSQKSCGSQAFQGLPSVERLVLSMLAAALTRMSRNGVSAALARTSAVAAHMSTNTQATPLEQVSSFHVLFSSVP